MKKFVCLNLLGLKSCFDKSIDCKEGKNLRQEFQISIPSYTT